MDIKNELDSNQTVLLVMSSESYNDGLIEVISQLKGNVCYVTASKTSDALKEEFKKKKVDREDIVFVDAISKTLKKVPDQADRVYYVSSPGALTELSLVVKKFLRHEFDYLVFDAITNLSVYQDTKMCSKFMTDLVDKVKKTQTKAVFYAIGGEAQKGIIDHTGQMMDKVVNYSSK